MMNHGKESRKIKHEHEGALSFIYEDKIETIDIQHGGKIITIRNKFTGKTTTIKKGMCRQELIDLHTGIVAAKWQRLTETNFLGKLI